MITQQVLCPMITTSPQIQSFPSCSFLFSVDAESVPHLRGQDIKLQIPTILFYAPFLRTLSSSKATLGTHTFYHSIGLHVQQTDGKEVGLLEGQKLD